MSTYKVAAQKALNIVNNKPKTATEIWRIIEENNLKKSNSETPVASLQALMNKYTKGSDYDEDVIFEKRNENSTYTYRIKNNSMKSRKKESKKCQVNMLEVSPPSLRNVTNSTFEACYRTKGLIKKQLPEKTKTDHYILNDNRDYIFTPFDLCLEQLLKVKEYVQDLKGSKILSFNIEYIALLLHHKDFKELNLDLHLYTDDYYWYNKLEKVDNITVHYDINAKNNLFNDNKLFESMKFDVVMGNPPYQKEVGPSKSEPIWHKFVEKSFNIIREMGYISLVHPSGWRAPYGRFEDQKEELLNSDIKYLSVNDFERGQKVFGVGTTFDFYVTQNKNINESNTTIEFTDGSVKKDVDIKPLKFIPDSNFDEVQKLLPKNGEERVDFLYSRSAYGTDKENVQDEKNETYNNPVVYSITEKDGLNRKWSSTDENGHFGVPKVIWSNGLGTYPIIDEDGEYGLTQFAYALAYDDKEKLYKVKEAMNTKRFIEIMDGCKFTNNKYSKKVMSLLRKDFWKEFV